MGIKKTFLALLATLAVINAKAQNTGVSGTIIDTNGKPLAFANVMLLSLPDSSFVRGATSNAEGHFDVGTAEKGLLKVSSVGYRTSYVNVGDFKGSIQMREDSVLLGTVVVKGQKPKTKLTGTSMVTSIEGTVLEKSGTVEDMLEKVPGMTKNGDDLEVLGKGTPIYYVNGRKLQDLKELKRLRSEEIKEVEVITNPGAQYDATASAVVRIKTIRRKGMGFGYDLIVGNNQDLRYGHCNPDATANLHYRHKALDVFGMVNYGQWNHVNEMEANQQSYLKSADQLMCIDQQSMVRTDWMGRWLKYNAGVNWQISDNHSVGMRIERHENLKGGTEMWQDTHMRQVNMTTQSVSSEDDNQSCQKSREKQPFYWEGNAYYNGKAGKLGIDLNVDFITYKSNEPNDIEETLNDSHSMMASSSRTSNRMIADKLVLSYPLWKGQVQAGTEMSFVTRKSSYQVTGIPLPSSNSKVAENNIAGFVEYGFQIPRVGNIGAGLRYEHVGFDYTDMLDASGSMSRYTDDLFPSLSWSQQFGSWQTSLSCRFKTARPDYWQLSEAINYLNPYSLQQGDPKLTNEKIREYVANVRWKWVNLFANYVDRSDALTQWSYIYNDEGVILIKSINLDVPVRTASVFLTLTPTWGIFSPNWTVGFQKCSVSQMLADPREATGSREVKYGKPIMIANLNNTLRLKHSWQLEAGIRFISKGDDRNFRLERNTYGLNFTCQKCWLKDDALCLRASVSDVLQRNADKIRMDCGYYQAHINNAYNRHRLNVSLRYTFNAVSSKYKGTGAGKEAAGRMNK